MFSGRNRILKGLIWSHCHWLPACLPEVVWMCGVVWLGTKDWYSLILKKVYSTSSKGWPETDKTDCLIQGDVSSKNVKFENIW